MWKSESSSTIALGENSKQVREAAHVSASCRHGVRILQKLGSCFMVPRLVSCRFQSLGRLMPYASQYDGICMLCSGKGTVGVHDSSGTETPSSTFDDGRWAEAHIQTQRAFLWLLVAAVKGERVVGHKTNVSPDGCGCVLAWLVLVAWRVLFYPLLAWCGEDPLTINRLRHVNRRGGRHHQSIVDIAMDGERTGRVMDTR